MSQDKALIVKYKEEIGKELANAETFKSLMEVTFKGLSPESAKRALLEGYMRGHNIVDFLKKDLYAIPFKDGYSLVTSIAHARKIAQKSKVWQSEPKFEMDGKTIISCTVTAYRRIGEDLATYPATVYFDEYSTGQNLWKSKPRTMIQKCAEMHALRKACPEELSQVYTEEEFDKERYEGAEKVSYQIVRKPTETFDGEEIPDDATITSTGDDTKGIDPALAKEIEDQTNG
jgi:hypothetical protein